MQYLLLIVLFVAGTLNSGGAMQNNVCKTFLDYYLIRNYNRNCYYNPDAELPEPEIIKRHGYPLEIHTVTTHDGYILSVYRIPHGKHDNGNSSRLPIFIQHGLLTSSINFYFRGNTSLAFILADKGYDVWMGNFRGVRSSDTHISLTKAHLNYWNFTFHELGMYDLPAQLNHVKNITQKKVVYIGLSMGTTAFYVYCSMHPADCSNSIRLTISMAPVAFVNHVKTPVKYLIPIYPIAKVVLGIFTSGSLAQRTPVFMTAIKTLCLPFPFQMRFCYLVLSLLFGIDEEQLYPEMLPIIILQLFDATSLKTLTHYIQLVTSGGFKYFDYGKGNMQMYGTARPPDYPLSRINVTNYLVRGKNDWLSTKKNVDLLDSALPNTVTPFPVYDIEYDKFTHGDFITAKDVKPFLYDHLVEFLQKYGTQFS